MSSVLSDAKALAARNIEAVILLAVVAASLFVFTRVSGIYPVILGDEWIYSVNAIVGSPWGPNAAGDYSNYLFNLIFSLTSLCGPEFYACAKGINVIFHASSALLLSYALRDWLPSWSRLLLAVAVTLGPSSVYTSMFLPESMFFFFMVLSFTRFIALSRDFSNVRSWVFLGVAIGASSLVKPHGLFMAISVGVFWMALFFSSRWAFPKSSKILYGAAFVGATVLARLAIGFLSAGPKSFNFFGSYINESTINAAILGTRISDQTPTPYDSPIDAVFDLFADQAWNLSAAVFGVASVAISTLLLWLLTMNRRDAKQTEVLDSLVLFVLIWLFSMVIIISAFAGWATGTGDDHSVRVLFRYFDFIVPVLLFLASAVALRLRNSGSTMLQSTLVALVFFGVASYTFSGFPSAVSIQIADAPYLAGLVVDPRVFTIFGMASASLTLAILFFKRISVLPVMLFLAASSLTLGAVAQDQYRFFRGDPEAADLAGLAARELIEVTEFANTLIVANTRFGATAVAFWMQSSESDFMYLTDSSVLQMADLPDGTNWVILAGNFELTGEIGQAFSGPGYQILEILNDSELLGG